MTTRKLYKTVYTEVVEQIKEDYKCHFTIKEVASKYNFSYGQMSNLYYKFRLKGVKKYDRRKLANSAIA